MVTPLTVMIPLVTPHTTEINSGHLSHNRDYHWAPYTVVITSGHSSHSRDYLWSPLPQQRLPLVTSHSSDFLCLPHICINTRSPLVTLQYEGSIWLLLVTHACKARSFRNRRLTRDILLCDRNKNGKQRKLIFLACTKYEFIF